MGRPKGSKNKKKKGVNDETIKQVISGVSRSHDSSVGISILDVTEEVKPRDIPVLIYDINSNRTKGIEKRVRSLVTRHKGFYLQTNILDDYNKYYIDIGGWAWAKDNHKYGKVVGHVKNLLPFLGGSNPIWKQKRSYQRHNVRRGIHLG